MSERSLIISKKDQKHRLNLDIKVPSVRVIGSEGEQLGILTIEEALAAAREEKLDLVELQPHAEPPVCRLIDYGKLLYLQKKKHTEAKKKQHRTTTKELKFRPGTEDGDYQVKLRNLNRFIEHGDKVKITIRFRGREMAHQQLGMKVMERIVKDLEGVAVVDQHAKLEGRQMVMVVSPVKN